MNDVVVHSEMNLDGEVVLTVIGIIDPFSAHRLVDHCRAELITPTVIDLRYVSLFTAAGITSLITLHEMSPITVVASSNVSRILDVTNLAATLSVVAPSGPPHLHRAPFGVAVHDDELRFAYVNDALASVNGVEAQAHYGRLPADLFTIEHDDVSAILREVLASGSDREVRVRGATAATQHGAWRCRYWRTRSPSPITGEPMIQVVATVDRITGDHSSDPSACQSAHASASTLVFEQAIRR